MTLLQIWEMLSIGSVSQKISPEDLMAITGAGCVLSLIQTILLYSTSFISKSLYSDGKINFFRIFGTVYGIPFLIVSIFLGSFEFLLLIQFSFSVTFMSLFSIAILAWTIIKIVYLIEESGSILGVSSFFQRTLARFIKTSPSIIDWIERIGILYKINNEQNKYLQNGSNRRTK